MKELDNFVNALRESSSGKRKTELEGRGLDPTVYDKKPEGSVLKNAMARRKLKRVGLRQVDLVTSELFATSVRPELEKMRDEFLEKEVPRIFPPLTDEIRQFIEEQEKTTTIMRKLFFYSHDRGKNWGSGRYTPLTIDGEGGFGRDVYWYYDQEAFVRYWEQDNLKQMVKLASKTYIYASGIENRDCGSNGGCVFVKIFIESGGLWGVQLGHQHLFLHDRSEESINKFTEEVSRGLEKREYLACKMGIEEFDFGKWGFPKRD